MKRRSVMSLAAGAALGHSLASMAQSQRVVRIGNLNNTPIMPGAKGSFDFRHEMARLGWQVGVNLDIEWRFGMNDPQRYQRFAEELVAARVDLIYALGDDALEAAFKATKSIPIVMIAAAAVELGYAKSLARPGGNVTGVVSQALDYVGKSLQLLRALRPDLTRIGISHRPGHPLSDIWMKSWRDIASGLGVAMAPLPFVRELADIDQMLGAAKREAVQALVGAGPVPVLLGAGFDKIQAWATMNKVLTYSTTWAEGEHLISFGPNQWELRRIAIGQVDRVLRGANPAELPIHQPTKFDFVLNMKIAKAMGLRIPYDVRLQATELIE